MSKFIVTRVLTSVCDSDQVQRLLQCQKFQVMLYTNLFEAGTLDKLRTQKALSNTEVTILVNLFETISNLW